MRYSFYVFLILFGSTFFTACGGGELGGEDHAPVTISVSVPSNFPSDSGEVHLKAQAPSPGSVTTVSLSVTDSLGAALVSTSVSVSPGETVSVQLNVPAGSARNFTVQAVDARGVVLFQGQSGPVDLFPGVPATVTIQMTGVNVIFVDVSGADGPTCGTQADPCRTITQGLSQASPGETVQVVAGTYDMSAEPPYSVASPITMISGVDLVGAGGTSTILDYTGVFNVGTAFVGADNVLFTGFGVLDGGNLTTLIVADDFSPTISNNVFRCGTALCSSAVIDVMGLGAPTITGNTFGQTGAGFSAAIQWGGSGSSLVNNNTIIGNTVGIGTSGSGSPRLEGNTITGNVDGVVVGGTSKPDLGGGAQGSSGGNVISCNTNRDLIDNTPNDPLFAQSNFWDHVPPTELRVAGGDLENNGGGTVDTDGATPAFPNCP